MELNRTSLVTPMASLTLSASGAHAGDLPRLQTRKLGRVRVNAGELPEGILPVRPHDR